jgi:immunity protein 8 of polymorphic toxin system
MHAILRSVTMEPRPEELPSDAALFCFVARMLVGPTHGPGEESFDVTVCSPEWLAERCRDGDILDGRHHVIVSPDTFSKQRLTVWLRRRVDAVAGETWTEIGDKLSRLGLWEFEDYTP